MKRRGFLAATVGTASVLAGCVIGRLDEPTDAGQPEPDGSPAFAPDQLPVTDVELEVGAPRDAIPAIVDPAFGPDWSGIELDVRTASGSKTIRPRLADADLVVGLERDGEARAYPLRILDWHEVVNETFDGPLLVTYCPLCRSAVVAERTVHGSAARFGGSGRAAPGAAEDGVVTSFGVSGLLYRGNLVLYDDLTGSLWSQIVATAIQGPETGARLAIEPSTLTTWGRWREIHDGTSVLLPPPLSRTVSADAGTRDYTVDPYDSYRASGATRPFGSYGSAEENANDYLELTGHHPKTLVLGVEHDGVARAYPLDAVRRAGVVNDRVDGLPVVVTAVDDSLAGYDRRVDGTALEFSPAGPAHLRADGSRWRRHDGTAVDGPHEGARLAPATGTSPLFWFAWRSLNPETTVYGDGD
ncbi:MAG: DUF3179 domain-containing protein [Haloarculaceae archaeon]